MINEPEGKIEHMKKFESIYKENIKYEISIYKKGNDLVVETEIPKEFPNIKYYNYYDLETLKQNNKFWVLCDNIDDVIDTIYQNASKFQSSIIENYKSYDLKIPVLVNNIKEISFTLTEKQKTQKEIMDDIISNSIIQNKKIQEQNKKMEELNNKLEKLNKKFKEKKKKEDESSSIIEHSLLEQNEKKELDENIRGVYEELNKKIEKQIKKIIEEHNQVKEELNQKIEEQNKKIEEQNKIIEKLSKQKQENETKSEENDDDFKIENFGNEVTYSFNCINKDNLKSEFEEGNDSLLMEIILENDGKTPWPVNKTKLVFNKQKILIGEELILNPQKPGFTEQYIIIFKNLKEFLPANYTGGLFFEVDGKKYGDEIEVNLTIKEKEKSKDKTIIDEFREEYKLSGDEFSDNKLLDTLQNFDFDKEKAFLNLLGDE